MAPLRLLIVSSLAPTRSRPDAGLFIARQARLLAQCEVEVRVVVPRLLLPGPLRRLSAWPELSDPRPVFPAPIEARNAWYFRPPGGRFTRYEGVAKAGPVAAVALGWHLERPFEVVLGVDMTADAVAAVATARALRLPVANLAIGSDVMLRPRQLAGLAGLLDWTLAHTDLPMAVSRTACEALAATGKCRRPPLCVYLGREQAPRPGEAERERLRAELGLTAHDVLAVFVGRLSDEKGMPELAQAAEAALARDRHLHLLCIGEGPHRDRLQQAAARAGRPRALHLPGRLAPAAVAAQLAAADFMVFPSRSEGMPQSVLEAMEQGLPVVATRVGGVPEAVLHEQTGLLLPPGDHAALAQAMARMASDAELRRRTGRAALEHLARHFDSRANARAMAEALRELAARRR